MAFLQPPKSGDTVWATDKGELRCWSLAPGVVVIRLTGYMEKDLVPRFTAHFERTWPGSLRAIFFDGGDMAGYDSAFRTSMTEWAMRAKERTGALHVWVQSKLAQMGVAVANLALGGVLRTHKSRDSLERAAEQAVKEAGQI